MQVRNWFAVVVIAAVLSLPLILSGCSGNTSPKVSPLTQGGTEVLGNVYDDQQGTVYIKSDGSGDGKQDSPIAAIMTKKKDWGQKFPAKKVVTMSIVYSGWSSTSQPDVVGLLIHYEQR